LKRCETFPDKWNFRAINRLILLHLNQLIIISFFGGIQLILSKFIGFVMGDMMTKLYIRHTCGLMFVLLNIEGIFVELKNFKHFNRFLKFKIKLSKIFLKFKFFITIIF